MSIVPLDWGYDPESDHGRSNSYRTPENPAISKHVWRQLEFPTFPAWGLLERAAAHVPDRVATHLFGTELTYAEVQNAATRLASFLQNQGIESGDRVAILLPNMPEYLIALNGIWRAGGVAVALSPLAVSDEISKLLQATDCRTVICLDILTDLLATADSLQTTILVSMSNYLPAWKRAGYLAARWQRTGSLNLLTTKKKCWFWDAIDNSSCDVVPSDVIPARDPAYILSTGGTADDLKAVTLSHQNIVANAWQQAVWAGDTMGQEIMLAVLPFFHAYGMSSMLAGGVAMGTTLIMQPRFDANRVLTAIERHRPTTFHAVPTLLSALNRRMRRRPADLSSLKWVISGGASLPGSVAKEFAKFSGAEVVEGFGLSEASPVTHVGPLDGTNRLGTIGFPLPGTECRIVDAETSTHDVPIGTAGELLIRGPQVMLGYWNNPRATSESIRDRWLYTGDLATVDADGFYRIVGRKKKLIITAGFNVYPADVEETLRRCEMIADAKVVGELDTERGEIVKALIVLNPGHQWNEARLDQFCELHLAAHRRPRRWEQVTGTISTDSPGKTLRDALLENIDEATEIDSAGNQSTGSSTEQDAS